MLNVYYYHKRKEILAAIEKCRSHIDIEKYEVELIRFKLIFCDKWIVDISNLFVLLDDIESEIEMFGFEEEIFKYQFWYPVYRAFENMNLLYASILNENFRHPAYHYLLEKAKYPRHFNKGTLDEDVISNEYKQDNFESVNKKICNILDEQSDVLKMLCGYWKSIGAKCQKIIGQYWLFDKHSYISYGNKVSNIKRKAFVDEINKKKSELTHRYICDDNLEDWEKVYDYYISELNEWSSGNHKYVKFFNDNDAEDAVELNELYNTCMKKYAKFVIESEIHTSINDYKSDIFGKYVLVKTDLISFIEEYFSWIFKLNYIKTKMFPELQEEFDKLYGIEAHDVVKTQNVQNPNNTKGKKKRGRPAIPLSNCFVCDDKDKQIDELKKYMVEALDAPSVAKYLYELKGKGILSKIPSYNALHDAGLAFSKTAWQRASKNAEPIKRPEKR